MKVIFLSILQIVLIIALAPLVTGIIKKVKALLQCRQGPKVLQVYYDINKHLHKETLIPQPASWVWQLTPYLTFTSFVMAGLLIPVITSAPFSLAGDVFLLIYLLAMSRFMMALSGLESGGAFGGMGSSREVSLGAIAEPALIFALMTVMLRAGTTNLSLAAFNISGAELFFLQPTSLLAFAALFIVALAETGRIPVDNPDTHLELTMIHEGMLLEYSGKELALMIWGAAIKQLIILTLLANLFLPGGLASSPGWLPLLSAGLIYLAKILLLALALAFAESSFAKMRLFKVPKLFLTSIFLSFLALLAQLI